MYTFILHMYIDITSSEWWQLFWASGLRTRLTLSIHTDSSWLHSCTFTRKNWCLWHCVTLPYTYIPKCKNHSTCTQCMCTLQVQTITYPTVSHHMHTNGKDSFVSPTVYTSLSTALCQHHCWQPRPEWIIGHLRAYHSMNACASKHNPYQYWIPLSGLSCITFPHRIHLVSHSTYSRFAPHPPPKAVHVCNIIP